MSSAKSHRVLGTYSRCQELVLTEKEKLALAKSRKRPDTLDKGSVA
jgi:hypothetical protein